MSLNSKEDNKFDKGSKQSDCPEVDRQCAFFLWEKKRVIQHVQVFSHDCLLTGSEGLTKRKALKITARLLLLPIAEMCPILPGIPRLLEMSSFIIIINTLN